MSSNLNQFACIFRENVKFSTSKQVIRRSFKVCDWPESACKGPNHRLLAEIWCHIGKLRRRQAVDKS